MAIITKPTIAKGQANEIDLSKSDLAAVSKVVNDSYFSNQANWSKVAMEYESDTGEQIEMLIFDASQESPKANFEVSEKAKDSWQVKSVIIMDFDGGYLKLNRGDLTVENFDIALGSVGGDIGGLVSAVNLNYVSSNIVLSNNNYTVLSNASYRNASAYISDVIDYNSSRKVYKEVTNSNCDTLAIMGIRMFAEGQIPTDYNLIDDNGKWYLHNDEIAEIYINIERHHQYTMISASKNNGNSFITTPGLIKIEAGVSATVGMAVDIQNKKVYIHVNGQYPAGHDPVTGSGGYDLTSIFSDVSGIDNFYFALAVNSNTRPVTIEENPTYAPEGYELV